jgi:predicted transcriptional regulator
MEFRNILSSSGNNHNRIHVEWRRNKVLELSSQGHTQSEIATVLQVTQPTVNKDLAYLRKQAQESLQHHIHETLPAEYQKCYSQINQVLRRAWEIVNKTLDERVRLQALALIDQCNTHKMDMVTNGTIITNALYHVNGKVEKLKLASDSESESKESEEPDYGEEEELEEGQEKDTGELKEEEEKTTNDVF